MGKLLWVPKLLPNSKNNHDKNDHFKSNCWSFLRDLKKRHSVKCSVGVALLNYCNSQMRKEMLLFPSERELHSSECRFSESRAFCLLIDCWPLGPGMWGALTYRRAVPWRTSTLMPNLTSTLVSVSGIWLDIPELGFSWSYLNALFLSGATRVFAIFPQWWQLASCPPWSESIKDWTVIFLSGD